MTSTCLHRGLGSALLTLVLLAGCTHTVKVEPIKVEPIDITLHIYLEADEKLDDFFDDVEEPDTTPVSGEQTEGGKS